MSFLEEFRSISTGEKTQRDAEIEKGKKSFRQYCNMINNDFFKKERVYQDIVCDTLQKMYERKMINEKTKKPYDILILHIPTLQINLLYNFFQNQEVNLISVCHKAFLFSHLLFFFHTFFVMYHKQYLDMLSLF